jgi:hypothetical protein
MPLLYLTPLHTPVPGSHPMNFFLAGSQIYQAFCKGIPNYDSYVQELQARLQSCFDTVRSNLQAKKEKSKEYYDKNTNVSLFVVGEKVLLHDEKVRRGRSAKLSPPFIGPYEMISIDDVNITLRLPRNKTLKVHANRLKPFFV